MVDSKKLWMPGVDDQLQACLVAHEAGQLDMFSYMVSTDQLRRVIRATDASAALKEHLIEFLDIHLLKDKPDVSCMMLGVAIQFYTESTTDDEIVLISNDIRNLNKLPYSFANGQRIS